ncbi:hypothetical protein L1987_63194 [Smallanthus sonchifolius]|uniref:Uncharacterized protein n=1 Tax=Smallanthus sonchifolius TaxID=185202 RepID=A0ACB9CCN0_9ASTR|nr:hypothetical protein L1987_63194 [Smallanthus sonchifolius]
MYGVNGSSNAISRDMNSLLYSSTFKHPADGEFAKIKQLISPESYPNYNYQNQQQQDESYGDNRSTLLRNRSTPSSFFSNLLNENGDEEFPDPVTGSSPEERFVMIHQQQKRKESESESRNLLQYAPSSTAMEEKRKKRDSTAATVNDSRRVPSLSPSNNGGGYGYTNQSNLDCASTFRGMDSTSSNLVRQNSTPAGFLSGFASMKTVSSSSALNNHVSFSLGSSSSPSRFLPQIAENKNELQDSKFSSLKRSREGVLKMPQNGETGNQTPGLVHHMSLPKTSSEMAVVENFLQFQQESTVPWKTRAKRGFATHPRSIAERVRRTRISERIKRLQELFPDIDKQSNTADMLDMAVEYIKNLQKELQTLNDAKARCTCSCKQLRST